jgi:hypothetical protein
MTPDLFGATPEPALPAIGMTVKLARDIDRARPCHAILRSFIPVNHRTALNCAARPATRIADGFRKRS